MQNVFDFRVCSECYGQHDHPHPQILMPLKQSMYVWIDNQEYEVHPNELCYIPSNMVHQCNFSDQLMVIDLSNDVLQRRDSAMLSYPFVVPVSEQITQLVHLIQGELKQNPNSKSVNYLYRYLYNKLLENCSFPSVRYIIENYDQPITVCLLADIEHYSISYFNDWFKKQTGLSPKLYLRYVRISKAKELLIQTDYCILDIAITVGYCGNATFTRAFRSLTGMTPKDYRDCSCQKKTG